MGNNVFETAYLISFQSKKLSFSYVTLELYEKYDFLLGKEF